MTKNEREEELMMYLETLANKLPVAEFYRTAYPTNAIKQAVAGIFCAVMQFLDEALIYYRSFRLGLYPARDKADQTDSSVAKLFDAVVQPTETKFKAYISHIDAEVRKLEDWKTIAHEAQALDMHETVTHTGKGMF